MSNKVYVYPPQMPSNGQTSLSVILEDELTNFKVAWNNLTYTVTKSPVLPFGGSTSRRVILKNLSGSFKSRQLTAVMGPSGAGKSTLLACICGKKTDGVTGDVKIVGTNKVNVSIITQDDYLTNRFTVREALTFASKAKNGTHKVDHKGIVNNLIKTLSLGKCANTQLGRCSGGQRKKMSIALELVSKPNILILDEPTSGLDSYTCHQMVSTLRKLIEQQMPMAIVATIHQPSARVFNLFHNIYVISFNGQCVYNGSPGKLIDKLNQCDIACPQYHNPADFIVEISAGEYGHQFIANLVLANDKLQLRRSIDLTNHYSLADIQRTLNYSQPAIYHVILLVKRSFRLLPRDPYLSWLRVFTHILNVVSIGLVFGTEVGQVSGCPPKMETLYTSKTSDLLKNFEHEAKVLRDNIGVIFMSFSFLIFGSITPMVLCFPNEINVFIKQYTNGWYSPTTYFISKALSDFPLLVLVDTMYIALWVWMTGQYFELWRFGLLLLASILLSLIGQSQGMMFSAIFSNNMVRAAYMGTLSTIPFMFLSGFFVRLETIPVYARFIYSLSYARYGFETFVISLYGFNRCFYHKTNATLTQPAWLRWFKLLNRQQQFLSDDYDESFETKEQTEEEVFKDILAMITGSDVGNEYQSMVMLRYGYTDSMVYLNLVVLLLFAAVFLVVSYLVLLWKIRNTSQR